jgi:ribosomal protein S18/ribosomal protein S6
MQNYNLYLILNPNHSSENVGAELDNLNTYLVSINAQNIKIEKEGLKKLAYPIKKYNTGFYVNIDFDLDIFDCSKLKTIELKLNAMEGIIRYLVVNQTDFLVQKSKEKPTSFDVTSHRDLNKGMGSNKKCIVNAMGLRELDYKETELLSSFTSPYHKIFGKKRTGSTSKNQRKIAQAIKRARHMALIPFTNIHEM